MLFRSVYVAPDVRVGHIEMTVSGFADPDREIRHEQITMQEWRQRNDTSRVNQL